MYESVMSREKKTFIAGMMTVVCLVFIVVGKVKAYHMTEGEALVELWPWWLGAVIAGAVVAVFTRKN